MIKKIILYVSLCLLIILIPLSLLMLRLSVGSRSLLTDTLMGYINFMTVSGNWRPLEIVTREPLKQTVYLPITKKGPLSFAEEADLYIPHPLIPKKEYPAFVLYAPFVPKTKNDPRIINLADTFAELGYVVLVPDKIHLPEINVEQPVNELSIKQTISSWQYLRDLPYTDDAKVGFFSTTYGVGVTILAISENKELNKQVAFLVGFGGYDDAKNIIRFALTGHFEYKSIVKNIKPGAYLEKTIKQNIRSFAPKQDTVNKFLDNQDDAKFESLYKNLPSELRVIIERYSPDQAIRKLRAPILLMHSSDDPLIPFTESLRLINSAKNSRYRDLALVNVFKHAKYKPLSWNNLRHLYYPSFISTLRFVMEILLFR